MEMKYDDGKIKAAILIEDFALALKEVAAVSTYGDLKYTRSSWKTVPDCEIRYKDAKMRHVIEEGISDKDDESELYHLAHEAWNCLALLQLKLESVDKRDYTKAFENAREAKRKQLAKKEIQFIEVSYNAST